MQINKQTRPNRPYRIEEYNSAWADRFQEQKIILSKILGNDAIRIEHMGSTAVPGLAAKPQIDILVEVNNLLNVPKYYDTMRSNGYIPRGDYTMTGEEYFTLDDNNGNRLVSIHIYPKGHPEIKFQINFREYLISHPDEVNRYKSLKLDLYHKYPDDYKAYGLGKTDYIKNLRDRVKIWSSQRAKVD